MGRDNGPAFSAFFVARMQKLSQSGLVGAESCREFDEARARRVERTPIFN
jgi:hypothetical protein